MTITTHTHITGDSSSCAQQAARLLGAISLTTAESSCAKEGLTTGTERTLCRTVGEDRGCALRRVFCACR